MLSFQRKLRGSGVCEEIVKAAKVVQNAEDFFDK